MEDRKLRFETNVANLSSLQLGLSCVDKDCHEGLDTVYSAGRWAVRYDGFFWEKALISPLKVFSQRRQGHGPQRP